MVEEEVAAISPPAPLESHKRKLGGVEPEPLQEPILPSDQPAAPVSKEEADGENTAPEGDEASQAKRLRLDDSETDASVAENGHQKVEGDVAQPDNPQNGAQTLGKEEDPVVEASIAGYEKSSVEENVQKVDLQADDAHNSSPNVEQLENVAVPTADKPQPAAEMPEHGVTGQIVPESGSETSRTLEIPNNMVGVLIGKAGDTIRNLQYSSGAKIQITRDADADPGASTRSVELVGSVDSIEKAEKLIKEVIAEADAGGSPALVAKGFTLAAGAMEQVEMLVPNEKVGLIIGKGGETIKNLQTRSGARIQLIPQHLPDGDNSKERTVRISGDKKQIDMARDLIKDVMNQNLKPTTLSSNYGQQQAYRPRGPPGAAPQWGPRGPHSSMPYDHHQHRGGPYSSQNQQYPPYGGYPSQGPPRGSFGPGWEQRLPAPSPHNRGGGYDRYGGQGGGYAANTPLSAPHSAHVPPARPSGSSMGHSMPSQAQANYGFGQPPYSQAAVPQPYAGPSQQGYPVQQQYPSQPYSAPSQGAPPQPYPSGQPGNMPYQAPAPAAPPYGQTMPAQQPYPYGATPSAVTDGYSQPQPAGGAMSGYPQQVGTGSQPAAGYTQPGYSQAYGQYPTAQQGYGYQGQAVPPAYAAPQAYSGAPPSTYAQPAAVQAGYAQPATAQSGYVQPAAGQSGYAQPAAAQAGYAQPAAVQAGYAQPATAQSGYAQPAAAQSGYAQPAAAQSGYAQPAAAQAGYAQPAAAQAGYAQPAAAQAGYAQPAAAQAGYAQPAASQAGYTQPATSQAGYTQPAASQAGYDQSAPQQSGGYPAAPSGTAAAPAVAATADYPQQYDTSQVYAASG